MRVPVQAKYLGIEIYRYIKINLTQRDVSAETLIEEVNSVVLEKSWNLKKVKLIEKLVNFSQLSYH